MGKLTFRARSSIYSVDLDEIVLMEKEKRKIHLQTVTGNYDFYGKFMDIENQLDDRFARPHKSYVLNMDYIEELAKGHVALSTGRLIPFCPQCMRKAKKSYTEYKSKSLAEDRVM